MDMIKEKVAMLNTHAVKIEPLMKIADKLKVEPGYILLGIIVAVPLILFITMGE